MSTLGERLNAIHQALLDGSRTASLDLFREALDALATHIRLGVRGVSKEEAEDHATVAILGHISNPAAFDPTKSSLWTYLCLTGSRDALDGLRQRLDRADLMEKHTYEIELWGVQANNAYEGVEWKKDAEKIMLLHGDFIVQNDGERRVLRLILDGERSVSAYAKALDLKPGDDVGAEVKRVKDRINGRMRKVGNEL